MRLEIEQTIESGVFTGDAIGEVEPKQHSESSERLLRQGVSAAQCGDRSLARTLLLKATELDPKSADAWLWLASISEFPEELLGFLNNVLEIDPENERARQWETATQALLAKTFVQRGKTAMEDGQSELAMQYFETAIEHDADCEMAWYCKASIADTEEERVSCLERVLRINADNVDAQGAMQEIVSGRIETKMGVAREAAVAGDHNAAMSMLDEITEKAPDLAEAWMLRSQVVTTFGERMAAFARVLELDPENMFARSGSEYLSDLMKPAEVIREPDEEPAGEAEEMLAAADEPQAMEAAPEEQHFEETASVEFTGNEPMISASPFDAPAHFDSSEEMGAEEPAEQPSYEMAEPAFSEHVIEEPTLEVDEFEPAASEEPELELSSEMEYAEPETQQSEELEMAEEPVQHYGYEEVQHEMASNQYQPEPVSIEVTTDNVVSMFDDDSHNEALEAYTATIVPTAFEQPTQPSGSVCPYCSSVNDTQAFSCDSCKAVLSMADLEALLGNDGVDRSPLDETVAQMEAEWNLREFNEDELTKLAIGHFNLKNYEKGLAYLQEASRLSPNNVILSSQANAVAIRLEEIRRQSEIHDAMPKGKTILVVDDSATVRKLISSKLEKSGHNVICAEDGVEAMSVIDSTTPDLVLLDIAMPRMDGYSVCKLIRANDETKDIPVVMISGKDGFFDKVRGRMAGTTGYITKPFGPETLMRALETYLIPDVEAAE